MPPLTREERATGAKAAIDSKFRSKQRAFLDFVLSHYVNVGVDELDQEKLTPLLRLKYHDSISDAVADLGRPEEKRSVRCFPVFNGFFIKKRRSSKRAAAAGGSWQRYPSIVPWYSISAEFIGAVLLIPGIGESQVQIRKATTPRRSATASTRLSCSGRHSIRPMAPGSPSRLSPSAVRLPSQNVSPVRKLICATSKTPRPWRE
jgi:hypothetical protein